VKSLSIKSYAKLNLYLEVLNKRPDHYHNILTVFEKISLFDEITLKSRRDTQIKIISHQADVPLGEKNLAYQAASLLKKDLGINKGIDIKIEKRIPVASGLGGGSSNAASVLRGLNQLWNLALSQARLISYGRRLGADVPFFLSEASYALGRKRGDEIEIIPLKKRFWHLLLVPKIKVSTQAVYKRIDQIRRVQSARLTNYPDNVKMLLKGLRDNNFFLINKAIFNELEAVTIDLFPALGELKEKLLNMGFKNIVMSGSGPAMFVFVSSRKEGGQVCRQLGKISTWQTFLVRTV
jgi:4-diphosphocytidyl-2-C-methyl-D-erythritol kinase